MRQKSEERRKRRDNNKRRASLAARYLNANGACHVLDDGVAKGASLAGYVNVTAGDLAAFNDAISTVGPLSVSIDATPDDFYFYSGGLYNNVDCKSGENDLDHTVLAVGYSTPDGGNGKYVTVKNSWSTHWGEDGYVRIQQEGNLCGVATAATYAILA